MKTIVTRSAVIKPMATYCEPSLQARARAQREQANQREARARAERDALLAQLDRRWTAPSEAFPPAPEMPAKLALHQEQPPEPDPLLNPQYLQGLLLSFILGAATAILFDAGRP